MAWRNDGLWMESDSLKLEQKAYEERQMEKGEPVFGLEIRHMGLYELDFPNRLYSCLRRAGFSCVGDLIDKIDFYSDKPFAFLMDVPSIGEKSYLEIVKVLEDALGEIPKINPRRTFEFPASVRNVRVAELRFLPSYAVDCLRADKIRCVGDILDKANFNSDAPFAFIKKFPYVEDYVYERICAGLDECLGDLSKYEVIDGKTAPVPIRDIRFEDLGLSARAWNCLRMANLFTVGDVIDKADFNEEEPFAYLLRVRNMGKGTFEEILNVLDEIAQEIPDENVGSVNGLIGDATERYEEGKKNKGMDSRDSGKEIDGDEKDDF